MYLPCLHHCLEDLSSFSSSVLNVSFYVSTKQSNDPLNVKSSEGGNQGALIITRFFFRFFSSTSLKTEFLYSPQTLPFGCKTEWGLKSSRMKRETGRKHLFRCYYAKDNLYTLSYPTISLLGEGRVTKHMRIKSHCSQQSVLKALPNPQNILNPWCLQVTQAMETHLCFYTDMDHQNQLKGSEQLAFLTHRSLKPQNSFQQLGEENSLRSGAVKTSG